MENTSYVALSRQAAVRRQMEVIANNLANASTPAFKTERLMFAEYVRTLSTGEKISFVQDVAVMRDPSEGAFSRTGNPLDLAIEGQGYFAVETPDGERYTRNGRFRIDPDGQIVTSGGHPLLNADGQSIVLTGTEGMIEVNPDGSIVTDNGLVGQFQVVRFDNEQQLRSVGDGLYESEIEPAPAPEARLVQGMIEESNVKPVIEITRMIEAMRGYQGTQSMMEQEHERQVRAVRMLSEAA